MIHCTNCRIEINPNAGYYNYPTGPICINCGERKEKNDPISNIITDFMRLGEADKTKVLSVLNQKFSCAKKQKKPIHAEAKQVFCSLYEKQFGTGYYWAGKDAKALNSLCNKIAAKMKEFNSDYTDKDILKSYTIFLQKASKLKDTFLQQNFSLSIIDSQFNTIYIKIKSGKANISDTYKQQIIRDLFS